MLMGITEQKRMEAGDFNDQPLHVECWIGKCVYVRLVKTPMNIAYISDY